MTANGWLQILIYCAAILAVTKPLGVTSTAYSKATGSRCRVFSARSSAGSIEPAGSIRRASRTGRSTRSALLLFSVIGLVVTYAIQRLQWFLPFIILRVWRGVSSDLSFNTAVSFTTNTNWQGYSGEDNP